MSDLANKILFNDKIKQSIGQISLKQKKSKRLCTSVGSVIDLIGNERLCWFTFTATFLTDFRSFSILPREIYFSLNKISSACIKNFSKKRMYLQYASLPFFVVGTGSRTTATYVDLICHLSL